MGNPEKSRWKNFPNPREVDWLQGAKNIISDFFTIDYSNQTSIVYPNGLQWPRKNSKKIEEDRELFFEGVKILLTTNTNPSWGKRVKVAVERKGCFVAHNFIVITPNKNSAHITPEVIAAVVNWKVSNAWVLENHNQPQIAIRTVNSIPFPANLTKQDCQALTEEVQKLETINKNDTSEIELALERIDEILKKSYKLDEATYERLTTVYNWDTNPLVTLDKQSEEIADWNISGIVEEVDVENRTLKLWLSGFDNYQTVSITPGMPGWLLRPKILFDTKIPRKWLKQGYVEEDGWGTFYPQQYAYLSDDDLVEEFMKVFGEPHVQNA